MNRARCILILAALAAGCSGGTEEPGAVLRGPGALAAFQGIVAHESGTQRLYLAIANERGDELRLLDTTDNEIVASPGLVFPLSIPSAGRPILLAAAGLGDGKPDALAVISAGSNTVELIDTWSGFPAVVATVPLDADVLSLAAVPHPSGIAGDGRFVVGLTDGKLAVIDVTRQTLPGREDEIVFPAAAVSTSIGFDAVSLAPGRGTGVIYAASRGMLAGGGKGIARITLPAVVPGTVAPFDLPIGVATEAVSAVSMAPFEFPAAGSGLEGTWGAAAVERIVAVPASLDCGEPPAKPVRCGLLSIDPAGGLSAGPSGVEATLHPIAFPAPVLGIVATGRTAATLAVTTGGIALSTSGLGVVSAADGRIYLVDLARWRIASDTSPLAATKVTSGSSDGTIGLWGLGTEPLSAAATDLPSRVRVTPGFTTSEQWTLAYKGILPGLEGRAAIVGRDGANYWVAVQVGATSPVAFADLASLGVDADPNWNDSVEIEAIAGSDDPTIETLCPAGFAGEIASLALPALPDLPGGSALLTSPGCLTALSDGARAKARVSFRSGGLMLAGTSTGHAGRPPLPTATAGDPPAPVRGTEFTVPGSRHYYVTEPCTGACATSWPGLTFPFPVRAALGFFPGFLDANGQPTTTAPAVGAKLVFQTASGVAPTGRRPLIDGAAVSSALPSGLALADNGVSEGAQIFASFTSGLVMSFSTSSAPGSLLVIR